jgi:hypothetical protein
LQKSRSNQISYLLDPQVQCDTENIRSGLHWIESPGDLVENSLRIDTSFSEWKKRFLKRAEEDGLLSSFNRLTSSGLVKREVVLELLFHHVERKYGLGASEKDWNAFRTGLTSVSRKAHALAGEVEQLGKVEIFSLPSLTYVAFLSRVDNLFAWRRTAESSSVEPFNSLADRLRQFSDYIRDFEIEGGQGMELPKFRRAKSDHFIAVLKADYGEMAGQRDRGMVARSAKGGRQTVEAGRGCRLCYCRASAQISNR